MNTRTSHTSSAEHARRSEEYASDPVAKPQVIVLQVGARLHYAVPTVYAQAGALHTLYTDACASVGILSLARLAVPMRYRGGGVRRLLGRVLPIEVPKDRVRVETVAMLMERLRLRIAGSPNALMWTHERLRRRILRDGFRGANCLYCLSNDDLELMKVARDQGLALAYEQITPPRIGRMMREERSLFPGIERQDSEELVERGIARDIEAFRVANVVICPSEHVRQDVAALGGPTARPALIPYGIHRDWLSVPPETVPGRILFVGNVGLGKGNHYLAEAARLLKARRVPCEIRVVGPYHPAVISRPEFQGPTYVGQVPRDVVRSEFARADVFALPTVADGFAIVTLEALACGVPVVTTPFGGSPVRDGIEGFIVPVRDARALAERIEQVISDRALRERMSAAARQQAQALGWDRFGQVLMAVTREAVQNVSQATTTGPSSC